MESQEHTNQELSQPISQEYTPPDSYDELDKFLIDNVRDRPFPQTEYQCTHYVAGSHATKYRAIRQVFVEIASREHNQRKLETAIKTTDVDIKRKERDIANAEDPLDKEQYIIDLDDLKRDRRQHLKRYEQSTMELRYYLDWVKKETIDEEGGLQGVLDRGEDPEEEHKYWIARMAKQTACDLIAYNNISLGNIESILQMPEEDQVACLDLSMKYSGAIAAGIHQLRLNAEAEVKYMDGKGLPDLKYLERSSTESADLIKKHLFKDPTSGRPFSLKGFKQKSEPKEETKKLSS